MKILNSNIGLNKNTVLALGSFDGLHIGHNTLIDKTMEVGRRENLQTVVFTFDNHPLSIINPGRMPKLLTSKKIKIGFLEKMGIDILMLMKFTEAFMEVSPEKFIEMLLEEYKCKALVVGYNYRFGYKNLGDIELLKKLEVKLNFKLYVVGPVKLEHINVSSTLIRGNILEGEIARANKLLGHTFILDGTVIHGKKIGRTIGFPTLNLDYDIRCIVPKGGVYFTVVEIEGGFYKGITNVGYNPTVQGEKLGIETHVLNFNNDVYDKYFKVHFIKRIRDEKKFNSLEELKLQIEMDKAVAENEVMWF